MKRILILLALLVAPAIAQRPALVPPVVRFSDNNGVPLAFGKVYTYQAGTTTPLATYVDSTTGALNANPTILDATGSAHIFLGANVYKIVLQNAAGVTQWTADNIAQAGFQSSSVTSFNGRTGAVTSQTGDYSCAQVTNCPAAAITGLTGDVTATGPGSVPGTLSNTAVTPGSYTYSSITVDQKGRITSAASGTPPASISNDYVWTFTSCANTIGQPSLCIGTTTLPGSMPDALYTVHCDVFPGSEPSVQFIEIATWPLPTTIGSTLSYRMVQPMQNGTHGGVTMPVVCFAHHQAAAAFMITSFTGGQSGELGQSFVNPAFAATYTITPVSASITNTDSVDSPHALTTPFTSATLSGTFTHSTPTTTTFTLTATQGTTQTSTQAITWNPRIFGGVGASGAISATASSNTAVLNTSDVLSTLQLGDESVGQTFGPFTPSGQNIYLLLTGGSHTFLDTGTGFPFAMDAPITLSFVNQYGVTVTMYLYQSTNPLFGTYNIRVAS